MCLILCPRRAPPQPELTIAISPVSPDIVPAQGVSGVVSISFSTKRPRELLRTVSTLRITRALKKQSTRAGTMYS